MLTRFKDTLKDSGNSFTTSRRQIFEKLAQSGPITTAELATYCVDAIDRATVYRTVELFEKLGIINRIWHGFKSQIELSEIFTPHHHHAVCQQCGESIDIINGDLEKLLASIARERQFLAVGHVIELIGYCERCQNS